MAAPHCVAGDGGQVLQQTNKSPMSEITAANKQTEAARDGLAFF